MNCLLNLLRQFFELIDEIAQAVVNEDMGVDE